MTKKDFELVAKVLRDSHASTLTVVSMANALATTNPRFSKERFVEACEFVDTAGNLIDDQDRGLFDLQAEPYASDQPVSGGYSA